MKWMEMVRLRSAPGGQDDITAAIVARVKKAKTADEG